MLGGAVAFTFAFKRYRPPTTGGCNTDKLALRSPSSATCCASRRVARFTRTLGTLIGSGVPILQGLEITARTAGNKVIQEAIDDDRQEHQPGRHHRRAAEGKRRVPAHGGADDRHR